MEREKIDKKYKWDLSEIYSSDEKVKKDYKRCEEITKKLETFKGKVIKNSNTLSEVLDLNAEQDRILSKLSTYIGLNYTLDTSSSFWSKKSDEFTDFYSNISSRLSFIDTELAKLTTNTLEKYLKENKDLEKYKFNLEHIIKESKHILSLEKEILLSELSPALFSSSSIFDKIDNADVYYDDVLDKDGKKHKLTGGSYREFTRSSDRTLRKNAFISMLKYYEKRANTIGECLKSSVKTNGIISKLRNYKSSLERSLSYDDITPEFYEKVLSDAKSHVKTLHKMMDAYKNALNLDEMHIYDINARVGSFNRTFEIEEMKKIVKESLNVMGEDYLKVADEAFTNGWIDYYETKGKRSGAFSAGCYDTKPYILLNYTGSFDDLETLAHELGHSIHTYYSIKNRNAIDYYYPIFLAEIASTTQEVLLNDYLLKTCKTDEEKIYILNNILSNYKSTVFRQIEFAEFEKIIADKIESGENLTAKEFTDIYLDLQKFYYGPNVINDELIKYECLRIPHFYSQFYVYKYATGLAIAYIFANRIINNEKGAVDSYIKFISSGGKTYPLDILKEAGIDLNKENIFDDSISLINNYLDEFIKLTKGVNHGKKGLL